MSGESSSAAGWSTRLQPLPRREDLFRRADDPRLSEIIEAWRGDETVLRPGRAVLIGFPVDEGVRRNHGRPGAAAAPDAIRRCLARLTTCDPSADLDLAREPPLDLGNVRSGTTLEASQEALAEVIAAVLGHGCVPIVLGGGHETAYGHFLGHVAARQPVGIINLDAHLDVRPCPDGLGHSGSPFRQALEHPTAPLPGDRYVCLGAQPHAVSRQHWEYAQEKGCVVAWAAEMYQQLGETFEAECERLGQSGGRVLVSIDADVVSAAEVPGVSAPNAMGLAGDEVAACARLAGEASQVAGIELVEICPPLDRDEQSSRWAAVVVWQFLMGLAARQPAR